MIDTYEPEYPDYDVFLDVLMSKYDEMEELAKEKLEWEMYSLAQLPLYGIDGVGEAGNDDFAAARSRLDEFVANHCAGDYAALETMIDGLRAAKLTVHGVDFDGETRGGISALVGDVYGGLHSWQSETAEVFTAKYVDTIDTRTDNQADSFNRSIVGLIDAKRILDEFRKSLVKAVDDAITALHNYHPFLDSLKVGAELALTVVSFMPVVSLVRKIFVAGTIVVASKKLPVKSDMSILTFLQAFGDTLTIQLEEVRAGEALLVEAFEGYSSEEAADWSKYVCSKPVEPTPG